MRKAVMIVLALLALRLLPRALRREARAAELITLLFQVMITAAAPPSSKAYATEQRTAGLEARVGVLEQGNFASLKAGSVISQLQQGIFINVPGVGQVSMTGVGGPQTLHVGALANFNSGPNTAFLANLDGGAGGKLASPGGVALDPYSGGSFASGERNDYINDLRNKWNALLGTLIGQGYMS